MTDYNYVGHSEESLPCTIQEIQHTVTEHWPWKRPVAHIKRDWHFVPVPAACFSLLHPIQSKPLHLSHSPLMAVQFIRMGTGLRMEFTQWHLESRLASAVRDRSARICSDRLKTTQLKNQFVYLGRGNRTSLSESVTYQATFISWWLSDILFVIRTINLSVWKHEAVCVLIQAPTAPLAPDPQFEKNCLGNNNRYHKNIYTNLLTYFILSPIYVYVYINIIIIVVIIIIIIIITVIIIVLFFYFMFNFFFLYVYLQITHSTFCLI